MLIKTTDHNQPKPSEITPPDIYLNRRQFLTTSLGVGLTAWSGLNSLELSAATKLKAILNQKFSTTEKLNTFRQISQYNNFYEFGVLKTDPAKKAHTLKTKPWHIEIAGHAEKTGTFELEDFIKPYQLEERIYRLRCIEAWSMVIPWIGIPLNTILSQFKPTSKAKFVAFTTLYDLKQMPGQRIKILDWPYREALRIDEAMHPLTLLAVGLYGQVLPNQNGAPIRLVVPWKYGFKSIKSIVRIEFTEHQPESSWHQHIPKEYGFYANVNPTVDHPKWSQKKERRIGEFFKRKTLMFNGYENQVASLYRGMDLKKYF